MRPKQDALPAVVEEQTTPRKETVFKKERKRKSVVPPELPEDGDKPEEVKKVKVKKSEYRSELLIINFVKEKRKVVA